MKAHLAIATLSFFAGFGIRDVVDHVKLVLRKRGNNRHVSSCGQ